MGRSRNPDKPPLRDDGAGVVEWVLGHPMTAETPDQLSRWYAGIRVGAQRNHDRSDDALRKLARELRGRGLYFKGTDSQFWASMWGAPGKKPSALARVEALTALELGLLGLPFP